MRIIVRGVDGATATLAEGAARLSELFTHLLGEELNKLKWMTEDDPEMEISLADNEMAVGEVLESLVAVLNAYADMNLPDAIVDEENYLSLPGIVMSKLRPLMESEDLAVRAMFVAQAISSSFLTALVGAILANQFKNMTEDEQLKRLTGE